MSLPDTQSGKKIEILAPAGGFEQLEAAVRAGADAVYLGAGSMNARKNAKNFTPDELREAAALCGECGVKLHLAMNTLISDGEYESAYKLLELACTISADALIVQDIGLAAFIRRHAPELVLHASTQLSAHTPGAAEQLAQMGFSRLVLARELSLEEIGEIAASSPIETEVFIHGALCMSVSGQCFLSAALGGRSGNRGMCAQPCRLPFSAGSFGGCLSLKDMSCIGFIPELERMGVASIKIEGRMKRPEYVAAAVTACRLMRDEGSVPAELNEKLAAVFSRSGFTSGYMEAKRGRSMFGVRTKDDVTSGAQVMHSLHELYKTQLSRVTLEAGIEARVGRESMLTLTDGVNTATAGGGLTERAESRPLSEESARAQLSRMGGTPYRLGALMLDADEDAALPPSRLNAMRREALETLSGMRRRREERRLLAFEPEARASHIKKEGLLLPIFRSLTQIPENLSDYKKSLCAVCVPVDAEPERALELAGGLPLVCQAPGACFGRESELLSRLEGMAKAGARAVIIQNIGQLPLAKAAGLKIIGGFRMNVYSGASLSELEVLGASGCELSCELSFEQAASLGGALARGAVLYGRMPLMLTRNCPASLGSCAGGEQACLARGGCSIRDRLGKSFPVMCSFGSSEVLNSAVLCVTEEKGRLNMDFYTLRFSLESAGECERVIALAAEGRSITDLRAERTRGMYSKGVF